MTKTNLIHLSIGIVSCFCSGALSVEINPKSLFLNSPIESQYEPVRGVEYSKQYTDKALELLKAIDAKFRVDAASGTFTFQYAERGLDPILEFVNAKMGLRVFDLANDPSVSSLAMSVQGGIFEFAGSPNFAHQMSELLREGERVLRESSFETLKDLPLEVQKDILDGKSVLGPMLKKYPILCIGEQDHGHTSPKQLIVAELPRLKKMGLTTIFLEHVFADTMQQQIDAFLSADSDIMSPILKTYLTNIDLGFSFGSKYRDSMFPRFLALLIASKINGINVVAIDTSTSYLAGSNRKHGVIDTSSRLIAMNTTGAYTINQHRKNEVLAKEKVEYPKSIVLMGSVHLGTADSAVKGLPDLLDDKCARIVVGDDDESTSASFNGVAFKKTRNEAVQVSFNNGLELSGKNRLRTSLRAIHAFIRVAPEKFVAKLR